MKEYLRRIWSAILHEPVVVLNTVTAAITLAVTFGVDIPEETKVAILTAVAAALTIVARQQVTPVR